MANKITVEFEITDKGTLKQVTSDTNKLSKAVKDSSQATDQASKSKNRYNKLEKGAAQLTSNSTKSFAKQAQTIGSGLVPAYATLAANIFAVSAAFGALRRASGLEQLEAGLIAVGSAAGQNLPYIADQLREITGAAISTQSAMESVALGTSAGFSIKQMEELTRVAKGASLALGRDMEDAMSRLVRGAAKLEPEILDELGIMVRLDDVTRRYADNLGKTTDSLTNFERRMAFTNAIIDQGTQKFGQIAEKIDPNPYDQLAARFNDLTKSVLGLVNSGLGPFLNLIANNTTALIGVIGIFGTSVASKMLPALYEAAEEATRAAENFRDLSKEQLKQIKITSNLPDGFKKLSDSIKSGTISLEEQRKALDSLNRSLRGMTDATDPQKLEDVTEARKKLTESLVAHDIANVKDIQSESLAAIARGKFKEAIKLQSIAMDGYSIAMHRNMEVQGKLGKALSRTKIAVFNLTSSLKLAGTAFLRLLPYIGLAVTAFGLLQSAWGKLFGKGEAQKQAEEVVESFKSFNDINDTLLDSIDRIEAIRDATSEAVVEAKIYTTELATQVGILDQVSSGIQKLIKNEEARGMEKIIELKKEERELQAELNEETGVFTSLLARSVKENRLVQVQKRIATAQENLKNVSVETAQVIADTVVEGALVQIDANEGLKASLTSVVSDIEALQKVLQDPDSTPSERAKALAEFEDAQNAIKKTKEELEGLEESSRSFSNEFRKVVSVEDKPFSKVISSLAQINNVIDNTVGNSDALNAAWSKLPDSLISILGETPDPQGLQDYIKSWEKTSTSIAEAESNAKAFKSAAERIKDTKDLNTDAQALKGYYAELDKSIDAQNKGLEEQKNLLQKSLVHFTNKAEIQEKIAALDDEIAANNRERVSEEEKSLAYKLADLEAYKEIQNITSDLLDIRKDLSDIAKEDLDLQEKAIERELQRAEIARKRATFGTDSDSLERRSYEATEPVNQAQAELEAFEQLASRKLEVARQELNLNLEQIELDFELQHLKLEVIRAEAEAAGKIDLVKKIDQVMAKLPALQTATQEAAMAGYNNLVAQMQQEKLQLQFNISDAVDSMVTDITSAFENMDLAEGLSKAFGDLSKVDTPINDILGSLSTFPEIYTESKKTFEDLASVRSKFNETYADQLSTIADKQIKGINLTKEETTIQKQGAKLTESETRSKISMYAQYGQAVGSTLGAIADQQDTSTKEGFEKSKKMQMGAAVINTAAAVMNAMANIPAPANIAAAAAAAAMGASQIAQISSTEFGDSSAPFAGGSMSAGFSVGGESVKSTVLGSSGFSESYAKTDELLKEIHAKEYYQLRAISDGIDNLNSGVKGLNLSLVRDIPEWGDQQRGSTLGEYYAEAGMGGGWYTYRASVTSKDVTLQDVLAGKPIPLNLETTARQTKSSSIRDYEFDLIEGAGEAYTEQTANIRRLWENMYTEVASSTTDLAMMFGKAASEIDALTMKGIGVEIISGASDKGHHSTWVSPEDLEKHLQQAYSTMGDMLIEDILGDWLKGYQQLEEGLAETGFRVASTNVVIQEFLDYLDYGFKDLAQEVEVSMDLADQAGGLKDFQEAAETFSASFTSEADRFARSSFQLEKIFEGYSLTLPKTRDAFVDLMGTFDLTSEKGRDIFASLLTSIDMLEEYYAHLEEVEEKRAELEISIIASLEGEYAALQKSRELELETLKQLNLELVEVQERAWAAELLNVQYDMEIELLNALGRTQDALTLQREKELSALDPLLHALQKQIWVAETLNTQYDMEIELLNALGRSEDALALQREKELRALDPSLHALQRLIWATEDATEAENNLAKAREEALKDAESALKKAFEAEKDRLTEIFDDFMESIEKEIDKTSELIGTLSSAVSTLESSVESMQEITRQTYLDATMQIRSLTAEARAGRYGGLEDLSSLTRTLTSDTSQIYGSYEEYRRDRLRAQIAMANLKEELEGQLSIEERTLEVLEGRKQDAKKQHEKELENLDRQLNTILDIRDVVLTIPEATRQYEAAKRAHEAAILAIEARKEEQLSTINSSIISLSDVMSEFATGVHDSIASAAKSQTTLTAVSSNPDAEQSYLEAKAQEFTAGVASGVYNPADWGLSGSSFSASDVAAVMREQGMTPATHYEKYGRYENIEGFANGGTHTGGWRLVGEEGPELEYTGRSQIYSNSETKRMLDFNALAEEIKELRTDLKYANYQIAKNTGDTAKLMNRWDGDGLPEERVV